MNLFKKHAKFKKEMPQSLNVTKVDLLTSFLLHPFFSLEKKGILISLQGQHQIMHFLVNAYSA